ncbi:MAG: hypothetical protein KIS92_08865 [Planctomycetota bacterium]|nr:hypothetical protein [Planctomycetota bacterium]
METVLGIVYGFACVGLFVVLPCVVLHRLGTWLGEVAPPLDPPNHWQAGLAEIMLAVFAYAVHLSLLRTTVSRFHPEELIWPAAICFVIKAICFVLAVGVFRHQKWAAKAWPRTIILVVFLLLDFMLFIPALLVWLVWKDSPKKRRLRE